MISTFSEQVKSPDENKLVLRPVYCASVSGGKDSLFMLKYILSHLDLYPLDCVVHFELEIDYPFVKDIIDYMEKECRSFGIPFYRLRPEKTWEELFYKRSSSGAVYAFPTRSSRWCNSKYKLSCRKGFDKLLSSKGCYAVYYIGYCFDEVARYEKCQDRYVSERYPLVEAGIVEDYILSWARTQSIFNHYYLTNKRMGCMYCPLSSMLNFAYLYKYYPDNFYYMIGKMRETEAIRFKQYGRPFSVISSNPKYNSYYLEENVKNKWFAKLEEKEASFLNCSF